MDSRKYSVTEDGVVLQYFGKIKTLYSWDSVRTIEISKINYTTRSAPVSYQTVLRLVTFDEKNGPRKGYGFWATAPYTMFHWRSIITISYTEDRYQEFLDVCPEKVVDYRYIKRYWHDGV